MSSSGFSSMFILLRKCRVWWLGHNCNMKNGCIPNDILKGKLAYVGEPLIILTCSIKMFLRAVCEHLVLTLRTRRVLQLITQGREVLRLNIFNWRKTPQLINGQGVQEFHQLKTTIPMSTIIETVIPTSVSLVCVQLPNNNVRIHHLLSALPKGGLNKRWIH